MNTTLLTNHLSPDHTDKAISSRISLAQKTEQLTGYSLDTIVLSPAKMDAALNQLSNEKNSGNLKNALFHYYEARNGVSYHSVVGAANVRKMIANTTPSPNRP